MADEAATEVEDQWYAVMDRVEDLEEELAALKLKIKTLKENAQLKKKAKPNPRLAQYSQDRTIKEEWSKVDEDDKDTEVSFLNVKTDKESSDKITPTTWFGDTCTCALC